MSHNTTRELLFLCSGNVLRSAFCELLANHLELPYQVRSAATRYRNGGLFPESRSALRDHGLPELVLDQFRSTHIEDLSPAPAPDALVFGMTREHVEAFQRQFGPTPRCELMLSVLGRPGEIDDPLHTGRYEETFATLAACVEALR